MEKIGFLQKIFGKAETRADTPIIDDNLLRALISETEMTVARAMEIPAVAACVKYITSTIAALPIKLYHYTVGEKSIAEEVENDYRLKLVNDETYDTLDANQFKQSLIADYLLTGRGLAYVNQLDNTLCSLHYISHDRVSTVVNHDSIFKYADYCIDGKMYPQYQFIQLLQNTRDGVTGRGIIQNNSKQLALAYNSEVLEHAEYKGGGNKRGFLQAPQGVHLSQADIDLLSQSWNSVYKSTSKDCLALNDGINFKEISSSAVEMQLSENKELNNILICQLFCLTPEVLTGNCTREAQRNAVRTAIQPIVSALESALNRALLLEEEKPNYYFVVDMNELYKADMVERLQAYEIGLRNNVYTIDEVRYMEDLKPFGLNLLHFDLADGLLNLDNKQLYTLNTKEWTDFKISGNGKIDEGKEGEPDGNTEQ